MKPLPDLPQPKLALCMIVRNEEAVIERCLEHAAPYLHTVCIVDTGSTDQTEARTRESCRRLGLELRHEVYTGSTDEQGRLCDFSAARNRSLKLAPRGLCLVLDADDVLEKCHIPGELHQGLALVRMVDGNQIWKLARVFVRGPSGFVPYVGRVHEVPNKPCTSTADWSQHVVIQHRPDKRGKEGSEERAFRILASEGGPREPRELFYFGRACLSTKRHQLAVSALRRYLELSTWTEERVYATLHLAEALFALNDTAEALRVLFRKMAEEPRYAELWCYAADLHYLRWRASHSEVDRARAAACYQAAAQLPIPHDAILFIQREKYGPYPRAMLEKLRS